jgi:MFS transporter, DHA2 family, multidrug resistance protein
MATTQELPPLAGAAKILGTLSLSLATFMNVLDTSIANVSLSTIGGDLGVSITQVTWVITSFGVANAITVPLTGWLSQRFGAVRLFIASIALFSIASLMCGLATSLQELIIFRVIQGAVAGPMIPLSQALLLSSYPKAKAGTALAIWSMTTLVAPVMGPLLGGWITDNISWPWIFYINIPVGVFAAVTTFGIYRRRETARHKLPIDGIGLGLLMLWVGALQIMLDKGQELDWFNSPTVIALGITAVVGFCVFIAWELVENPYPIVDLRLFKRRNFWTGTLALSLGYGVFFGNVVLLPLWLQEYMGYTATEAGMLTAPVGILAIVVSPFVGRSVGKVDPRWLGTIGFVIFAVALHMRTHYNTQADFGFLVVPIIVQGAAMAFFFVPLISLVLSGLPPDRVPAASGLSNFARIVCGSFGTSIATTLWDNRAILHHAQLTEYVRNSSGAARSYAQTLQAGGLSPQQAGAAINRSIDVESHLLAANDVFWISSILFLLMIGVIWLARPSKSNLAPGAAGGAH